MPTSLLNWKSMPITVSEMFMLKLKVILNKLKLKPLSKLSMKLDLVLLWLTLLKESLTCMSHLMLSLMPLCLMLSEMVDKCGTKMINYKKLHVWSPIDVILLSIKKLLLIVKLMDNSIIPLLDTFLMLV
jgi:hypothetical protein